ncbi:MAG TPA: dihydrodipicolinate synthase family protein [Stellaceae bacterium]
MPLLTHYRRHDGVAVDRERMAAHVASLRPHVRQFLLAGSTGDGWELELGHLLDLAALARDAGVFDPASRVLFGLLRRSTDEVVEWAAALERDFKSEGMPAADFAGFAVCPPADAHAGQDAIRRHYERVLEATSRPIAVYELPQVTGCAIAPSTLRALAANPRITMFKDSSGADTVARAGPIEGVVMLRGAEGDYVEALRPEGPYDGWLLSTANVFAEDFRRILRLRDAGKADQARDISALLSRQIAALFKAAGEVPFGNAFSNANRAGDHLLAHGSAWRSAPAPLTVSGHPLPRDLLAEAAQILARHPGIPERGYLPR